MSWQWKESNNHSEINGWFLSQLQSPSHTHTHTLICTFLLRLYACLHLLSLCLCLSLTPTPAIHMMLHQNRFSIMCLHCELANKRYSLQHITTQIMKLCTLLLPFHDYLFCDIAISRRYMIIILGKHILPLWGGLSQVSDNDFRYCTVCFIAKLVKEDISYNQSMTSCIHANTTPSDFKKDNAMDG